LSWSGGGERVKFLSSNQGDVMLRPTNLKTEERQALDADIKRFLAAGGRIRKIPTGEGAIDFSKPGKLRGVAASGKAPQDDED
jgi:hypothetical protein